MRYSKQMCHLFYASLIVRGALADLALRVAGKSTVAITSGLCSSDQHEQEQGDRSLESLLSDDTVRKLADIGLPSSRSIRSNFGGCQSPRQ